MPKKLSLNDAIKIAESHGGKCLSIEYINNITPMLWECNKFHQWTIRFYNIKNKHSWCPHCVSKKLNISVARELALAKNGRCISENYINNRSPLLWECKNNHQFRLSLAEVKKQIRSPLSWSCSKGHSWLTQIDQIQRGAWCPYCSKYKRENLCREIVSKYLGPPSKIRQPEFLKTPKHPSGLHLDIYYPQYGFAIEVQGQQHEKYIEFFHRSDPNNFIKQQERDQLKKELCENDWIVLRKKNDCYVTDLVFFIFLKHIHTKKDKLDVH
ncbi:hypothetical protein Glove_108g36 [Diversispora epigaea]|uniref:Treble clef zinc finger domain-containing protein n=1 Tax=Diversispora epigaea TaxID=1348612 RepID=A0A397J9E8_9GLOM|nr:hypothetical protein Glove_108g36 [Diversispora epigaea]